MSSQSDQTQQQQQQQPQSEVERRANELSSAVEELRGQLSDMRNEMQRLTVLLEKASQEQRVDELSSDVKELRRQVSDMRNEMQRQTASHEGERTHWEEERQRMISQLKLPRTPTGRVPDWLHLKIMQERARKHQLDDDSVPDHATSRTSESSSESDDRTRGNQVEQCNEAPKTDQTLKSSESEQREAIMTEIQKCRQVIYELSKHRNAR